MAGHHSSELELGVVRGVSYGLFGPPDIFIPQARALGANLVRVYVYWSQVEPRPGRFDWSVVDALLNQLDSDTVVWMTVCSSSPWGTRVSTDFQPPSPAVDDEAYAAFVTTLVTRCGGRVRYWQCNNEPSNTGLLWAGTAEDYTRQLAVMARSVRQNDPAATVVLGGCGYDVLSSPEGSEQWAFFDAVVRDGRDHFDLFSIHLYDDPYLAPAHIKAVRDLMHRHGYERPVVVGEYNGPTLFEFPAATTALENAMLAAFAGGAGAPVDMSTTALTAQLDSDPPDRRALRQLYANRADLPVELQLFMADAPPELADLRDRIAARQLAQRALLAAATGVQTLLCWQLAPEVGNYTDPLNIMDLLFGRLPLLDFADGQISTPRPLAHVHRRLAAFLRRARTVQRVEHTEPDTYAFRVSLTDGTTRLAAWIRENDLLRENTPVRSARLPWPHRAAHGIDVLGHLVPTPIIDGYVHIEVSATTAFVSPEPLTDHLPPATR